MNEEKNILPNASYPQIYKKAIDILGANYQIDIAIEEMSELIKALLKHRRATTKDIMDDEKTKRDITEEMGDVLICLTQLAIIFDNSKDIDEIVNAKIKRLINRLASVEKQNIPITDFGFSVRIVNALQRANVYDYDTLLKSDLRKIHCLGKKSIAEINAKISEYAAKQTQIVT